MLPDTVRHRASGWLERQRIEHPAADDTQTSVQINKYPDEMGTRKSFRQISGARMSQKHNIPESGNLACEGVCRPQNKKRLPLQGAVSSIGRPCRDRTYDQRIKSPLLYQLS